MVTTDEGVVCLSDGDVGASSDMCTPHSEYQLQTRKPLQPNFDLHSDTDALWVEGIGHIAQYHCYCDMLYSHGVIYFLRDWLFKEIEIKIESGVSSRQLRPLTRRLNKLNSKIRVHERSQCQSHA